MWPRSGTSSIGILRRRTSQADRSRNRLGGAGRRPFYFRRETTTIAGNINPAMTLDYCRVLPRSLHCPRFVNVRQREEEKMKNPLDSLWGTVIAGLVLTVILYYITKTVIGG